MKISGNLLIRRRTPFALAVFSFYFLTLFFSCRKDNVTTSANAKLNFSVDTLLFDTVFTTMSSTTKRLKIFNKNSDKIIISSIAVENGANSQFRINVDGVSGNVHKDIEIDGNDSLFIFLEVTIDPNNVLSPFVVEDKILFSTNGNKQSVQLMAWGQNAHYFTPKNFFSGLPPLSCLDGDCSSNATPVTINWTNDKPYVIVGFLVIDSLDKLTIDPGVRVHLHNNSGLWVYKDGNIRINGTTSEPVTFQGTRLEFAWQDIPGQWDRIWINEGNTDNVFNNVIIKNAFVGIQAETLPFNPNTPTSTNKLRLNNCEIKNSAAVGLLASNYQITDTNSIITNSGQLNMFVKGGGNYQFYHTTIANFWNQSTRSTPALFLQNYYQDINGNTQVRDIDSANFFNCIIDGNADIEFDIDELAPGKIKYRIDHAIVRTTNSTPATNFFNIIKNPLNTIFTDVQNNDYTLAPNSPANNAGKITGVVFDRAGNPRNSPPDLGAFEN